MSEKKDRFAGLTDEALELGLEVFQMGGFLRHSGGDSPLAMSLLQAAGLARGGWWVSKPAAEAMRMELEKRRLTKYVSAAFPATKSAVETLKEADDCSQGCKVKRAVDEFVNGCLDLPLPTPEPAAAEPTPGGDGWTEWKGGGGPPVPGNVRVKAKLKNGTTVHGPAQNYYWYHNGLAGDIVAYRSLGKQPEPKKENVPAAPASTTDSHQFAVGDEVEINHCRPNGKEYGAGKLSRFDHSDNIWHVAFYDSSPDAWFHPDALILKKRAEAEAVSIVSQQQPT